MKKQLFFSGVTAFFLAGLSFGQPGDVSWIFGDSGLTAYLLNSYSPAQANLGTVGASNPDLNLLIGKRYEVTVVNFSAHPLDILAKAATSAQDIVLLSAAPGVTGTLESDPAIAWQDLGGGVARFTMTRALFDAMVVGNRVPGYRCAAHASTMRGNLIVLGDPINDPIPGPIAKTSFRIELTPMITGIPAPLRMEEPPDGSGRLFVLDQSGLIYVFQNGQLLPEPLLDVSARLVSPLGIIGSHDENDYDERGLLGMAIHPDFADPAKPGYRKIYTYTSEPYSPGAAFTSFPLPPGATFNHDSVIAEWSIDPANPNRVDPATRRQLTRIDQPQFNHNGGPMAFGPDGYLYIALGDGGGANDVGNGHGPTGNGQNINTVHGSILRIDPIDPALTPGSINPVSASSRYRIPFDNPFIGKDGIDEIFAVGFRNPYSFGFDIDGRLIVGDVGQNNIEEVDIVRLGGNYGWNLKEGTFRFLPSSGQVSDFLGALPPGLIDPVVQYDHDEGIAILGGFVYRGETVDVLRNLYVFGDFATSFTTPTGRLFVADMATGHIQELTIGADDRPLNLFVKGMARDRSGELYVLASSNLGPYGTGGVVLKIVALCDPQMPGDLNGDCNVNIEDVAVLAADWLKCSHRNPLFCNP